MTAQPETVWVLDDHFLIAEAIGKILAEETGYQFAGGFTQSATLLEALRQQGAPNYLLLDINLNGEDGIALCKQLKKSWPALHI
ncbi:MAG: response regulator, partial [Chitinophagaceae bacterium]|nr:response regulator [Chitinophagaceae bacterium]